MYNLNFHKGNVLAYYTHWGGLLLLKFGEWISINSNADTTKLQSPVGNLLVFSTPGSIETIDMVWFQLVHKEPSIMSEFWSWYLPIEGLCKYRNLFSFSGMSTSRPGDHRQVKETSATFQQTGYVQVWRGGKGDGRGAAPRRGKGGEVRSLAGCRGNQLMQSPWMAYK